MSHPVVEGYKVPLLAAASLFLGGSAVVSFLNLHDQKSLWDQQSTELRSDPAVFTITSLEEQPDGKTVTSWERERYDGTSHFNVRINPDGTVSVSDPYEPTATIGRKKGPIVPCSSLNLDVYDTHTFKYKGESYNVLLTTVGNAAVCLTDR